MKYSLGLKRETVVTGFGTMKSKCLFQVKYILFLFYLFLICTYFLLDPVLLPVSSSFPVSLDCCQVMDFFQMISFQLNPFDYKSINLQYNMLVGWNAWTKDSLTKPDVPSIIFFSLFLIDLRHSKRFIFYYKEIKN